MSGDQFHIRLNAATREKLEMIANTFGVSLSAAIRVSINASYDKLGFEKKLSDEGL